MRVGKRFFIIKIQEEGELEERRGEERRGEERRGSRNREVKELRVVQRKHTYLKY